MRFRKAAAPQEPRAAVLAQRLSGTPIFRHFDLCTFATNAVRTQRAKPISFHDAHSLPKGSPYPKRTPNTQKEVRTQWRDPTNGIKKGNLVGSLF